MLILQYISFLLEIVITSKIIVCYVVFIVKHNIMWHNQDKTRKCDLKYTHDSLLFGNLQCFNAK